MWTRSKKLTWAVHMPGSVFLTCGTENPPIRFISSTGVIHRPVLVTALSYIAPKNSQVTGGGQGGQAFSTHEE